MMSCRSITLALTAVLVLGATRGALSPPPGAISSASSGRAPATARLTKVYTNTHDGVSLRYPSTWNVMPVPAATLVPAPFDALAATATLFSNANGLSEAGLFVLVGSGSFTAAQLTAANRAALLYQTTPLGSVQSSTRTINGVLFHTASLVVKVNGVQALQTVLSTIVRHTVYLAGTTVALHRPTTSTNRATIGAMLSSLTMRGMAPTGPSTASSSALVLRTVTVGANPSAAALDGRDGHVFVTSDAGVSMLDARTGAVLRTIPVRGYLGAVSVDEAARRVYVIDAGSPGGNEARTGTVSLLDARTGALLTRTQVGKTPLALACDTRTNRAFVTNQDSNTVSVLDATTGRLLRTVRVGQIPGAIVVAERVGHVFVADQNDNNLYELDARTGAVVRRVNLGDTPGPLALLPRLGRVYVGFPFGNSLSAVDARTGAVMDRRPVNAPLDLVADAATNRLAVFGYVPGGTGQVSLLNAASGAVMWTLSMQRPKAVAFDDATGRAYVADVTGSVSVVNVATGRTVARAMADALPQAVVVDSQTGRAFVLSVGMIGLTGDPVGNGTVTVLDAARHP